MALPSYVLEAMKQQEQMSGGQPVEQTAAGLPDYVKQAVAAQATQSQPPPGMLDKLGGALQGMATYNMPERLPTEKEYWTQNLPESARTFIPRVVAGAGNMLYNAAKEFTDPVVNGLTGKQPPLEAASDFFHAPEHAIKNALTGMAEYPAALFGMSDKMSAKEAWSDPAMAAATLYPAGEGMVRGAGAVAKSLNPGKLATKLTRKSMGFTPSTAIERQVEVANILNRENLGLNSKSYDTLKERIKTIDGEVADIIAAVADEKINFSPREWLKEITDKAEVSGTPTDVGIVSKYLESIEKKYGSPEGMSVETARKIRINLNDKLNAYYKKVASGNSQGNSYKIKAMEAFSTGLRQQIEKVAPETKALNWRSHELRTVKPYLNVAINKTENIPTFTGRDIILGAAAGVAEPGATLPVMIGSRVLRDPGIVNKLGRMAYSFDRFKNNVKAALGPQEAVKLVQEFQGMQMPGMSERPALPPGQNRLALPAPPSRAPIPGSVIRQGYEGSGPVIQLDAPYQSLYDIAATPAGKQFLMERFGRDASKAGLLRELLKVPDSAPAPPVSQSMLNNLAK